MKSVLILLGFVLAACAPASQPAPPALNLAAEERAIRSIDSVWQVAAAAHDPARESELFADDAVAYRNMTDPIVGPAAYQEWLTKYYVDNPKIVTTWVTRSITMGASGDMAVQTGTFTDRNAGAKGDQPTSQSNFVTVWKKVNGFWKVAVDIGQPIPAPKP